MEFRPKGNEAVRANPVAVMSFAVAVGFPAAAAADAEVLATVDGEAAVTWYDIYFC